MDNKKRTKKLFWDIFNANDEDELHDIVKAEAVFSDEKNWYPYGGKGRDDRSNFSTFENQQPHPIPAFVEKITNSIDSLLLKHCRLKGINPESPAAPKTMGEAVELFYGMKNGDFSEVGSERRREIAENIQIVATGDKTKPNLLIYDNGEGQHPRDFPKTFLSLHRNNKTGIHFVQGKYNMGATGAVVFCGNHRYQLIASKRHEALNPYGDDNNFGFTLIRRHPLTEEQEFQYGSSWYEYFVMDGEIPHFPIEEMDFGLSIGRKFTTGSIVKMYSYQLPRGSRSDIRLDLWRDLNQYLYQPALPMLLVERRYGDKREGQGKPILGNKTRIVIDDRDKKEKTVSLSFHTNEIGNVAIEATVFKHHVKQQEFIKGKAVIFTVNGQVHGFLPRSFISQTLGFSMLRDSLLVQVDCTNIRTSFRQDLFMANRYNLKEGETLEVFLDRVIDVLKSNSALREINQNRKNRILRDTTGDEEILKELLKSIPLDKDLINLLKKDGALNFLKRSQRPDQFSTKNSDVVEDTPYLSKRFPSIFKLDLSSDENGKKIKSIPLNGKGVINFETDVEDEYLFRPHERGELQVLMLGPQDNEVTGGTRKGKPKKVEDFFNITVAGPTNNSIRIIFEPKSTLSVGEEIELNARLSSPSGDLESIFYIKVVDPKKRQSRPKPDRPSYPALPTPVKVFEKKEVPNDRTWQEFNWSGEDIVKVYLGETEKIIEAIAINMDSYVVKRYISRNKLGTQKAIKFIKNKFFSSVYLHSLFLFGIMDKLNRSEDFEFDIDIEDLIPVLMKPYSSFLLHTNTDDTILESLSNE